jgi:hypothetical protein
LVKRLKVKFSVNLDISIETNQENIIKQEEAKFFALAGSFDLPESSDELIKSIEDLGISKELKKLSIPF